MKTPDYLHCMCGASMKPQLRVHVPVRVTSNPFPLHSVEGVQFKCDDCGRTEDYVER